MHLGVRNDKDHGRTRTVVWANGSETDLGVLVAASIASTVCAASAVCAVELRGVVRVAAIVLAVVSGLYAAAMIVPLLVVFGGIFVVKGMVSEPPTVVQRASWVVAAAVLGGLLGLDAYSVGVPGLLTGPIVIASVVAALGAGPAIGPQARRRSLGLAGVVAVAALGVGLTIFL